MFNWPTYNTYVDVEFLNRPIRGSWKHLLHLTVVGRPAAYATAAEVEWKEAVNNAINNSGAVAHRSRFAVRIVFRTPQAKNANEKWDIDNLVKPTLDAMSAVFGERQWRGLRQAADDRVDYLEAEKRGTRDGELPGADIDIWLIE